MFRSPRSRWLAAAGGFLALLTAPLAFAGLGGGRACGPHGFGMHGPPDADALAGFAKQRVGDLLDELDATPDQREAIEAIVDGAVPVFTDLHTRGAQVRAELSDALASGAPRATVEALRADAIALADEGSQAVTDRLLDAREVLTAEQWQRLQELRSQRHGWWR